MIILGFYLSRKSEVEDARKYLDKSSECTRLSNIISQVYAGEEGTEAIIQTDYLISFFNYSMVVIQDISDITPGVNNMAFLASEAGPTSYNFYLNITSELNPDWYKACFSDLDGNGCGWQGTSWMNSEIPYNVSDMINNLSKYDTIYLEDPHIYYNTDYIESLEDWVSEGKSLILSEHVMCREQGSGSYSNTSYRCNPPGSNSDNWNIFDVRIHQRAEAHGWSNCWNVEVFNESEGYNLELGEKLAFEERSWAEGLISEDFEVIARYRNGKFQCGGSNTNLGDSQKQPSIAFWKYGDGMIFYFGDFQVEMDNNEFSADVLTKLIETAYYFTTSSKTGSCVFYGKVFPAYDLTGEISIKKQSGGVLIENE